MYFVDERLNLALYTFDLGTPHFEQVRRKIEASEAPYDHPRGRDDSEDDAYQEAFENADVAIQVDWHVLRRTCANSPHTHAAFGQQFWSIIFSLVNPKLRLWPALKRSTRREVSHGDEYRVTLPTPHDAINNIGLLVAFLHVCGKAVTELKRLRRQVVSLLESPQEPAHRRRRKRKVDGRLDL
jgi:hypothetical protein